MSRLLHPYSHTTEGKPDSIVLRDSSANVTANCISLTAETSQIKLGTAKTLTISAPNMTTNVVLTIPPLTENTTLLLTGSSNVASMGASTLGLTYGKFILSSNATAAANANTAISWSSLAYGNVTSDFWSSGTPTRFINADTTYTKYYNVTFVIETDKNGAVSNTITGAIAEINVYDGSDVFVRREMRSGGTSTPTQQYHAVTGMVKLEPLQYFVANYNNYTVGGGTRTIYGSQNTTNYVTTLTVEQVISVPFFASANAICLTSGLIYGKWGLSANIAPDTNNYSVAWTTQLFGNATTSFWNSAINPSRFKNSSNATAAFSVNVNVLGGSGSPQNIGVKINTYNSSDAVVRQELIIPAAEGVIISNPEYACIGSTIVSIPAGGYIKVLFYYVDGDPADASIYGTSGSAPISTISITQLFV